MQLRQLSLLLICMVCFFSSRGSSFQIPSQELCPKNSGCELPDSISQAVILTDEEIITSTIDSGPAPIDERESLFPEKSLSLVFSHFTWGAELGCSIDMTGHDQSTVDVDVNIGYKNDYFRNIGVGFGIHKSVDSSNTFIPIYFLMRTSFRPQPSLCFMHFKAGYSFNTISKSSYFGDVTASLGLGVNLAMTKRFRSHIILAYAFRHFSLRHRNVINLDQKNISLIQLSFGVNF